MKFSGILFTSLILFSSACNDAKKEPPLEEEERFDYELPDYRDREDMPSMIKEMLTIHNFDDFKANDVITFDINLTFGGKERLNGTIYSKTNSSKVKIEKPNGVSILYDGEEVYLTPDTANYPDARFDALAWQYFALAPFKFSDEGTKWGEPETMPLREGDTLKAVKLHFNSGTGDAPDDWYYVYQNDETKLLEAMAYIVTIGDRTVEEAENNIHAITYSNYKEVDTTYIATKWKFWNWDKETGLQDQIGEADITNIRYTKEKLNMFNKNNNYELVPLE